ncbi:MAG: hypothetical protein IKQ17_14375 [Kiritimatiellae bacterium]|nr:hypothetical protein [Kiritimatiellia bacterium]
MTYDQLACRLREFQSISIHWDGHEIDMLLNKGFICVESIPSAPLQVFHGLYEALDQWYYPEVRKPLKEIITEVDGKEIVSNPTFREIAHLDPTLLVGPTNLQRNSITGGMSFPDSPLERHVRSKEESISACLYDLTLDTKIYQTLEWRWLKRMLVKKEILFRSPSDYHDAWESFMFRKYDWEERYDECRSQLTGVEKYFYCSCWSACEESDGIWNNHIRGVASGNDNSKHNDLSKNKEIVDCQKVKIETTVGELLFSLGLDKIFEGRNIWKNFRSGAVGYFDESELRIFKERTLHVMKKRRDFRLQYYLPYFLWQSFFMKRKQFEYEQEVRLVLFDNADGKSLQRNQDLCGVFLQTDAHKWIHEVVVHPDCPLEDYRNICNQLSARGIDRVVMSSLYKHTS